ncbi:uncharacterized protein FPRO_00001 [Fusarium proliferatum ET1]|uniref:Uncharacterized protein n=1 Tax=Fusarium proliferatum (strain ET1) TaxID=1227346 RepID=A0A1L7V8L9_FUSPR|nr:uncharacterized protein FPRO_00001 [Fusarium proliferatum ET1]CZR35876.1 uncharacterized protein FPRO_00001 [Fusarium proliferatum ET1]
MPVYLALLPLPLSSLSLITLLVVLIFYTSLSLYNHSLPPLLTIFIKYNISSLRQKVSLLFKPLATFNSLFSLLIEVIYLLLK